MVIIIHNILLYHILCGKRKHSSAEICRTWSARIRRILNADEAPHFFAKEAKTVSAKSTQAMNIAKGVGIGMALGAAAGMLLKPQKKTGKRVVSDAMKAFGDVAESISDFMGW